MSMEPRGLTRGHIFAAVLFAFLLYLLYELGRILAPFSSPLIWAVILTLTLSPLHRRVRKLVQGRETLAALLMTFATLAMIVTPLILLLAVLAGQALDLYTWTSDQVRSGELERQWSALSGPFFDRLSQHPFLSGIDLDGMIVRWIKELSSNLASQLGAVLKNAALVAVNLVIMLISLFFLFRDGESYYQNVAGTLPFTREQREAVAQKFLDTFRGVINGVFLIAALQGLMTGIGFALFGLGFPVFWGFLAAVLALLPVGGAALVWLPGAAYLFLTGAKTAAILLTVWGVVLVSLPDNILKPLLIGRKAKIPAFLLFLGILGGLKVYGLLGILFGPLVVTLLAAFVQIYREEYAER